MTSRYVSLPSSLLSPKLSCYNANISHFQAAVKQKLKDETKNHPNLQDFDEPASTNGDSTAAPSGTGTPMTAGTGVNGGGGPKLKLTGFGGGSGAMGGGSARTGQSNGTIGGMDGVVSDED